MLGRQRLLPCRDRPLSEVTMGHEVTLRDVPELLHDASLRALTWNPSRRSLAVVMECLRRNRDGSELPDRSVTIMFDGVTGLAVGYDSPRLETRPSEFDPGCRFTTRDLLAWAYCPHQVVVDIDCSGFE